MYKKPQSAQKKEPIQATTWEFNNIRMGHVVSVFDDYAGFSASNTQDTVRLHFGLRGDYRFMYQQLHRSFDLVGGHHNIMYSPGINLDIYNKTLEVETFGIDFPKEVFIGFTQPGDDLLNRFTEQIRSGTSALLSENWGTVTPPIQRVIDEIVLNPYSGELQNIFLLAKSLELLVLCVDNYQQSSSCRSAYLKRKSDRERVMAARDFINERVTSPPNLSEIAKVVGLNEFKLKRGFKEMFHSTVFGYLTERRLNLARQYLLDTQKTAAEIAIDLGYSSPQHFSHQFRKKFGATPNSVRKNP